MFADEVREGWCKWQAEARKEEVFPQSERKTCA
jgi:hypothetical protein